LQSGHSRWFTKKRAILAAVIVVLVGAGVGTWLATSGSSAAPLISTETTVQTIATGTISQAVSTSGTIEPANQAGLDFGVSGRVTAVDATVGQTVTVGQALATIDDTSLSAALVQAQASLANDQAQLASDESAGASSAQIASDQAAVTSAQTQVSTAQTSLSEATLTSTIAGTVASVDLTVGQQVSGTSSSSSSSSSTSSSSSGASSAAAGGSSFGGATAAGASGATSTSSSSSSSSAGQVVVVSTGSYLVNTTVDSTQVSQVKVGDQATITVSGATSDIFGTVASVGLLASTTSDVASFPVVVDVTGSPSGLYGGSSATVSITTEELRDVVVVPTAALHYSGNSVSVLADEGGKKVTKVITVGAASAGDTQVLSGLAVGDKVYETEVTFRGGLRTGTSGARAGLFGDSGSSGFTGGAGGGFGGGGGYSGGAGGAGFGG
jgi:macrolide-specific efflux system membrane fusion protein